MRVFCPNKTFSKEKCPFGGPLWKEYLFQPFNPLGPPYIECILEILYKLSNNYESSVLNPAPNLQCRTTQPLKTKSKALS